MASTNGNNDDQQKPRNPFTLCDPPSSPTQPLLSSKPSTSSSSQPDPPESESESDQSQYLQISYNHSHRPFKDLIFFILFTLLVLISYAFGLFSVFNRNPNYHLAPSFTYDTLSSSCVRKQQKDAKFTVLGTFSEDSDVLSVLIWTLVVTFVLSIPICLLLVLLLKKYTKYLVYAALPFFVVIPILLNVYWFVACTVSSSCRDGFPLVYRVLVLVFVFLVIGVVVWIFVVNWHRVELTVMIIGVASDALWMNLWLFLVVPLMTVGVMVLCAPVVVFLVYARFNGRVVPREEVTGEYSCVWKEDKWVPAYFALGIITILWSFAVLVEAQVYVISGTVAQWYFFKEDSSPKRSIRTSLRHAFGPSFGTVCLSGILMCVVRVVRAAVDSARQEDMPGMVNVILRCLVNVFLSSVEFLNKFTINFAAITGEAYCSSARMTYELLRRNLLSPVFVETVSTRVLAGIVFVLSAIYAIAVCAIIKGVSNLGIDSYFVAALAWVLLIVVLGFFVHVLENVIDTVYICYAIDRDRGEVCKQEVHEVYVQLPISRNHKSPLASTAVGV